MALSYEGLNVPLIGTIHIKEVAKTHVDYGTTHAISIETIIYRSHALAELELCLL